MTRRGSTEVDVPEYRASPTSASQRDFASTTRGSEHAILVQAIWMPFQDSPGRTQSAPEQCHFDRQLHMKMSAIMAHLCGGLGPFLNIMNYVCVLSYSLAPENVICDHINIMLTARSLACI